MAASGSVNRIRTALWPKRLQYKRLLMLALATGGRLCGARLSAGGPSGRCATPNSRVKAQENTRARDAARTPARRYPGCAGNLLATSIFVKTVCADPSLIGNRVPEIARVLAPLLAKSRKRN